MEKGSLRCDANVSLRRPGEQELRPKAELKNMNSFRFLERGIEAELRRQAAVYEGGGSIALQTLHYDPQRDELTVLRSKEEADDYRYFPEPDLVPMEPSSRADRAAALASCPSFPRRAPRASSPSSASRCRTRGAEPDAGDGEPTSSSSRRWRATPKTSANWIMGELSAYLNEHALAIEESPVAPAALARLIGLVARWHARLGGCEAGLRGARRRRGRGRSRARSSSSAGSRRSPTRARCASVVDEVVAANPGQAAEYRAGKDALLGFFVGQVMRSTGGRAEPRAVQELLREALAARPDGERSLTLEPR